MSLIYSHYLKKTTNDIVLELDKKFDIITRNAMFETLFPISYGNNLKDFFYQQSFDEETLSLSYSDINGSSMINVVYSKHDESPFTCYLFEEDEKIFCFAQQQVPENFQLIDSISTLTMEMAEITRQLNSKNSELDEAYQHLKNTQEQLVESEKLASLGQLIAGIAHETNTPLGVINGANQSSLERFKEMYNNLLNLEVTSENRAHMDKLLQNLNTGDKPSIKKSREIRKGFMKVLEEEEIENARRIADNSIKLGVYDNIQEYLPILKSPNAIKLLESSTFISEQSHNFSNIAMSVQKASKIIFALKNFVRQSNSMEKEEVDLLLGLESVLTVYHSQIKLGIELELEIESVTLSCYPDSLIQVWTNLIHNALQAMHYEGRMKIVLQKREDEVLFSVSDSGTGIPEEIQGKIFKPFFTTKPQGEGTGLGLDIVQKIVHEHSGEIGFDTASTGTTFWVKLPIVKE